jgi:hypothetical protein
VILHHNKRLKQFQFATANQGVGNNTPRAETGGQAQGATQTTPTVQVNLNVTSSQTSQSTLTLNSMESLEDCLERCLAVYTNIVHRSLIATLRRMAGT